MVQSAVQTALAPVKAELAEIKAILSAFVTYEVDSDAEEAEVMGVVSDKVDQVLAEAAEQTTVVESLVVWAQGQREVLEQVRADLAAAIANGATDEDLAGLDEAIASFDTNTGRVGEVVTQGTVAEGETPVEPAPVEGEPAPVEPGTGV